jgi:hypothetical protein
MARIVIPLREDVWLIPGIRVVVWPVDAAWAPGSTQRTRSHDDQTFAAACTRFL